MSNYKARASKNTISFFLRWTKQLELTSRPLEQLPPSLWQQTARLRLSWTSQILSYFALRWNIYWHRKNSKWSRDFSFRCHYVNYPKQAQETRNKKQELGCPILSRTYFSRLSFSLGCSGTIGEFLNLGSHQESLIWSDGSHVSRFKPWATQNNNSFSHQWINE